jgi:hypothetical protein
MKDPRIRRLALGLAASALTVLNACAVTGGGVDGSVGYGYDTGYYEPWGYDYGGWGYGYRVGPGRGGERRGDRGGGDRGGGERGGGERGGGERGGAHQSPSYRPAPGSRPTPSIPHGSRGSHH